MNVELKVIHQFILVGGLVLVNVASLVILLVY